jgi:hypothetical protein
MGSSGSYAGLYVSKQRENYSFKTTFWLVAQITPSDISKTVYGFAEDLYRDKSKSHTFKSFLKDERVVMLHSQSRKNRQKCMTSLIDSLDLDLAIENSPMLVTESNYLYQVGDNINYYCGATNVNTITNGIIFSENPYLGSVILKGADSSINFPYGKPWATPLNSYGAFPTGTGRICKLGKAKENKLLSSDHVVYEKRGKDTNKRLGENLYRQRTSTFKASEVLLGRKSPDWGEIPLEPILVKISSFEN